MVEMTMTNQEAIRRVVESMDGPRRPVQDNRPWWVRLFSSIRPVVKVSPSLGRPVKYVGVKGGVEF
jgi:hypothetical protein